MNTLILIDYLEDFCNPKTGKLYVNGADLDIKRIIKFIKRNKTDIHNVISLQDFHQAHSIFFPMFWVNNEGENPEPFTEITEEDVINKKWKPILTNYNNNTSEFLKNYVITYTKKLKDLNKRNLIIWPYHCLVGSKGASIVNSLFKELFNLQKLKTELCVVPKGCDPRTDQYSGVFPEYGCGITTQNWTNNISSGKIIFAGEAMDYCVYETMKDFISILPKRIKDIYILEDCMSTVSSNRKNIEEKFKGFYSLGVNKIDSNFLIKEKN